MPLLVELDRWVTWPPALLQQLESMAVDLDRERAAERAYFENRDPLGTNPPAKAAHQAAERLVDDGMSGTELLVFHATRLVDPDEVGREGLRPLKLTERIERLRVLARSGPLAAHGEAVALCLSAIDGADEDYSRREGQVWATPLRRQMHDGGCDPLFGHWGGEALRRIAGRVSPALAEALQSIGQPYCVAMRIPTFGWCTRSRGSLARTMIELVLERHGLVSHRIGWDVMIERLVPPERIVKIAAPDDPFMAAEAGMLGTSHRVPRVRLRRGAGTRT